MRLQFKIKLLEVEDPEVWRQVLVPSQFTFHQFHQIIQEAFGWEDCHLYEFVPKRQGGGPSIGPAMDFFMDEEEEAKMNSENLPLSAIFIKPRQKYMYNYDFGDGWTHEITLEKIIDSDSFIADCTGGKGTCPPEDCGGPFGYMDLKEILKDPKHPEYKEMREWLGLTKKETWETDNFNRLQTSKWLQRFSVEYL